MYVTFLGVGRVETFTQKIGHDSECQGTLESNWQKGDDTSFQNMGLREDLVRGIHAYGFEKPSHIQQYAILPSVLGHDLLVQSHSGTGKTAAWGISVLQNLDVSLVECQAIILPMENLIESFQLV